MGRWKCLCVISIRRCSRPCGYCCAPPRGRATFSRGYSTIDEHGPVRIRTSSAERLRAAHKLYPIHGPLHPVTGAPAANPDRSANTEARGPASEVLQDLLNNLPPDHFTLAWLSRYLRRGSFGVIILILALIAMVPGV